MPLPALYNVPTDEKSFSQFSFTNRDEHTKIFTALRNAGALGLVEFIIDPIPMWDFPAWAYRHQQMHNQQNAVLGIDGSDLTTVDFTKPDQLSAWIGLHAQEHYQAAATLGID